MKNIFFLLFLSFSFVAYSQVINEEELIQKIQTAKKNCVGAHESIVLRTNEDLARSVWGKNVRMNEVNIIKYFNHPSGEPLAAVFDINLTKNKNWTYPYDQQAASDLFTSNGVRVTSSYNKLMINARQELILAENDKEGSKMILELYCPREEFLQVLRIGQPQSIEFLISGILGGIDTDTRISGIVTKVYAERQVIKCSNGHEYDKDAGYKFCPTCGEPLK